MILDHTDLKTCRVGLLWIRRHRELYRQAADPAVDRAIGHLEEILSVSARGLKMMRPRRIGLRPDRQPSSGDAAHGMRAALLPGSVVGSPAETTG